MFKQIKRLINNLNIYFERKNKEVYGHSKNKLVCIHKDLWINPDYVSKIFNVNTDTVIEMRNGKTYKSKHTLENTEILLNQRIKL